MLVIVYASFKMSKWKLKEALHWLKVDIVKRFVENLSYLSFGTVDV